ncbi:MAG: phospholipid-binding protein MlaC [Candidatus Tectimicrobiota bacterium]
MSALLLVAPGQPAEAGEPQEKVRQTVEAVVAVLADKSLPAQERRSRIRRVVLQRFGFEEMAQRSLAQHWRPLTPQQRQEFVTLFTDLLERSYVSRIESTSPEAHAIRYAKEEINNDQAAVYTEITSSDEPVSVAYRLLHRDGDWKVYDIVIEGVSLVNNYRTQFNTIIAKDAYAGLVKQMRLKREQENAVPAQQG